MGKAGSRIACPASRCGELAEEGDDLYKMDTKNIVTIWEELSDDLMSLAGEQLVTVWRLVGTTG